MSVAAARTFEVRHVQLARALFAAIAAVMITFSRDHSAPVGLAIFSGWAIATALVMLVGAGIAYPRDRRAGMVLLGALTLVAGMVGGLPPLRSTALFFVLVIVWALAAGTAELVTGIRHRRDTGAGGEDARDAILIGAITIALGLGLLLVNPAYSLEYFVKGAGQLTLTGIVIGVGLFGGYAAIVAVFLGIAAFSPRRAAVAEAPAARDVGAPPTSPGRPAGGTA